MNPKDLRPWLGLASFTEAEATRFFGREEELAELLRGISPLPETWAFWTKDALGRYVAALASPAVVLMVLERSYCR